MPKSDLVIWGKYNKELFSKMLAGDNGNPEEVFTKTDQSWMALPPPSLKKEGEGAEKAMG